MPPVDQTRRTLAPRFAYIQSERERGTLEKEEGGLTLTYLTAPLSVFLPSLVVHVLCKKKTTQEKKKRLLFKINLSIVVAKM